ncbi:MAG: isoamylase early set domain-containing protein [Dissulfurispiraceae bacterium]
MNTKKQSTKKTVTKTKNNGGNVTEKTQVDEKPSVPEKLLTEKNTTARSGAAKKPVADKLDVAIAPAVAQKAGPKTKSPAPQKSKAEPHGIMKEYTKSRNLCKVTFILPGEAAPKAQQVAIVGDFNNWNMTSTYLGKTENGDFSVTLELEAGKEYRFRYLIDNHRWENDWFADKYLAGPYGVEDSVVSL